MRRFDIEKGEIYTVYHLNELYEIIEEHFEKYDNSRLLVDRVMMILIDLSWVGIKETSKKRGLTLEELNKIIDYIEPIVELPKEKLREGGFILNAEVR